MKDVPSLAGDKSRHCLSSRLSSHPWVLVKGLCRGCREGLGAACKESAGLGCQPGCMHRGSPACRLGAEPGRVLLCLSRAAWVGGEGTRTRAGWGAASTRDVDTLKGSEMEAIYKCLQTNVWWGFTGAQQRNERGRVRAAGKAPTARWGLSHKPAVGLRKQESHRVRFNGTKKASPGEWDPA